MLPYAFALATLSDVHLSHRPDPCDKANYHTYAQTDYPYPKRLNQTTTLMYGLLSVTHANH